MMVIYPPGKNPFPPSYSPPQEKPKPKPPAPVMPELPPGIRLAHAYVPWQVLNKTYSLTEALQRGTLFPELDMPYDC